jgi:diacylglycerol kinase family enzyme
VPPGNHCIWHSGEVTAERRDTGPPPGPAAIFVNEGAGSARSEQARRSVELVRDAFGAEVHVTDTRDTATFEAWLRERVDGFRTLVIAGGDGSLGVAYNVVTGREDVRLGYIPAGFGNATAHLLRLPRDPERLTTVLTRGETRPVDLVAVDGRLALFAGVGWDARVARRYAEGGARRLPGWVISAARSLPDLWRRPSVEVRADGWLVHRGPMELLVVSTTPFYGRGLKVNPGARPDAGRLALRVYPGPAPSLALEAARWALRRRPRAVPVVAHEVEVRAADGATLPLQADGDVIGEREAWRFEVRPAAVQLIGRWS